ncbi:MAG TPA: ATP-binding protein [Acidisarcina sp.]
MSNESIAANKQHALPADLVARVTERCEDEQIQIPGSIQTHGFLLLLDESSGQIVAASENAEEFLGVPFKLLLGAPLETLLDREPLSAIKALMISAEADAGLVNYLGAFRVKGELCSLVTHKVAAWRVLEFEKLDRLVNPELMNAVITNFVGKLSSLGSEQELCQAIARQIQDLTGFNRVLLYSFDDAGDGTVLAEERDGALPSYLDLRFPASDIPPQARSLYITNTTRCIPDASYTPSQLRGLPSVAASRLDLSRSVLRSVSPTHLEYMRNMGTAASMSVSIVSDGKLWGLISAHHATPRSAPFLIRSACDLLTKLVGTQLRAFRTGEQLKGRVHFHAVHRQILTQMAAENDYVGAMESQIDELMKVENAEGVAFLVDGRWVRAGNTPDIPALLRIVEWLDRKPGLEIFQSRELGKDLEWTRPMTRVASGMLAIRISDVNRSYILWFRPEVVRTVKWAGEPGKPEDLTGRLSPRLSFEIWQQKVHGRSAPWTEMEIESACEFRKDVLKIILKRAEEAEHLSEARFQQLTHAIPTPVWTSDDEGNLTYVNQRWREQELSEQGRWFDAVDLVNEEGKTCQDLWQRAVSQGVVFEEEVRLKLDKTGPDRWSLVRAVPFQRADGTRAGWVGTCTDLTDRRERELAVRMTEKLALMERMTSVIAHEINNPLEAMTNLMYLLKGMLPGDTEAQEYLSMAGIELDRISGITKQTLRWSREDAHRPEWTSAGYLFGDTLRLFAGKIRSREVTMSVQGGAEIRVFGVTGQLRQLLANLVSNALDAVPVGGRVSLEARQMEDAVQLIVADAGSGMTAEVKKQIFQPFFSTKGDLGNGLGLYISLEIVQRHRGELVIDSEAGRGTTVVVRLPLPVALPGQALGPANDHVASATAVN